MLPFFIKQFTFSALYYIIIISLFFGVDLKKKIITFILITVLVFACVVGIGCSKASCTYNTCTKCGNCASKNCERCGETVDCADFLCNAIMGEACHDRCRVSCWYNCAEDCRIKEYYDSTYKSCDHRANCYTKDLVNLDSLNSGFHPGDFYQTQDVWTVEFEKKPIKNLNNYFKLTVTFHVTMPCDVEDLFIVFDVKEVVEGYRLYNYCRNVLLMITENGKKGKTYSASVTFTLSNDGEADRIDSEYIAKVHKYLGRI